MRSSATAADNAAHQASRISAQLRADVSYLYDAARHHRPQAVVLAVLLAGVWWGAGRLRRYYGRRWIRTHLQLVVTPAPATDFTLHRPPRQSLAARALRAGLARSSSTPAEVRVVRVQLAGRSTTASCTELVV